MSTDWLQYKIANMDPDRCQVITKKKIQCENLRSIGKDKCTMHLKYGVEKEKRRIRKEQDEKSLKDLEWLREEERKRIQQVILKNPAALETDLTEVYATNNPRWIKSDCNIFAQYGQDGTIVRVCICNACCGDDESNLHQNNKCVINNHCIYCMCKACVCQMQIEEGKYDTEPITPYWDNPCMSTCCVCSRYNK
jgi:hypothetical protein